MYFSGRIIKSQQELLMPPVATSRLHPSPRSDSSGELLLESSTVPGVENKPSIQPRPRGTVCRRQIQNRSQLAKETRIKYYGSVITAVRKPIATRRRTYQISLSRGSEILRGEESSLGNSVKWNRTFVWEDLSELLLHAALITPPDNLQTMKSVAWPSLWKCSKHKRSNYLCMSPVIAFKTCETESGRPLLSPEQQRKHWTHHHCVHEKAPYEGVDASRRSHQSTEGIKDGAGQRACGETETISGVTHFETGGTSSCEASGRILQAQIKSGSLELLCATTERQ